MEEGRGGKGKGDHGEREREKFLFDAINTCVPRGGREGRDEEIKYKR